MLVQGAFGAEGRQRRVCGVLGCETMANRGDASLRAQSKSDGCSL